ncbi:hypothetical protein VTK56DRAFT_5437 [Thermocarpiscus australiensis]
MIAMDPQRASSLVQVPTEVLIRIVYHLPTKDLGSVRLTCKAVERKLFNSFSYEFFRKKQFMVSTGSLQALVDISKHPTLSPCLKHVIICTERMYPVSPPSPADDASNFKSDYYVGDHLSLMATGVLRDMLAEAFGNLTNLETVDIRDFLSNTRNRDGIGARWNSYGRVTMTAATGAQSATGPVSIQDHYASQIFAAAMAALAVAQSRPKSIEVLLRNWRWGLGDCAFFIPPRLETSIAPVLSSLQSLHLSLGEFREMGSPWLVQKFVSLAHNLTWLRLNFKNEEPRHPARFLSWLALKETESSGNPRGIAPVQFGCLERLDLGSAVIAQRTLLKLVAKFAPTLRWLSLRRVGMYDDKNNDSSKTVNPWLGFLRSLPKVPGIDLRTLAMSDLIVRAPNEGLGGRVLFKDGNGRESGEWTCSTRLEPLEKVVQQAYDSMSASWWHDPGLALVDESADESENYHEGDDYDDDDDDDVVVDEDADEDMDEDEDEAEE